MMNVTKINKNERKRNMNEIKIRNLMKASIDKYNQERMEQAPCVEDLYYHKGKIDALNEMCEILNINAKAKLCNKGIPQFFVGTSFLDKNCLPEFKGQIVDIFEAYLDEKGITIPNEEKEDTEDAANIFGDDYDRIANEVDFICESKTDNENEQIKLTKEESEDLVNGINNAFNDVIAKANKSLSEKEKINVPENDMKKLEIRIHETLKNWKVSE